MTQEFNPSKLSESEYLNFYGALFAIADSDGSITIEESSAILKTVDYSNLSDSVKQQLQAYFQHPPSLENCLDQLKGAKDSLRWGLLSYLIYVAWVDRKMNPGEVKALQVAKEKFNVSDKQVEALQTFVQQMIEIRENKLTGKELATASKAAVSDLTKQGIPILTFFETVSLEQSMNSESLYSEEGLWEKIKKFASTAGKEVIEKVLLLFYSAQQPNVPLKAKATIFAALGYFIMPIDALPDGIPAVGFGDDLTALATALAICAFYITPEVKEQARQKMRDWFGDSSIA